MVKFGCGILMLAFGAVLTLWLAFNLLIARQKEFVLSFGGLFFIVGLCFVGIKWVQEGWPDLEIMLRPPKRRKKKRRPVVEDDE